MNKLTLRFDLPDCLSITNDNYTAVFAFDGNELNSIESWRGSVCQYAVANPTGNTISYQEFENLMKEPGLINRAVRTWAQLNNLVRII